MFDDISGWHAGVETALPAGLRIAVPMKRVAEVCQLLAVHQIPHEIELDASRASGDRTQPKPALPEGVD